VTETATDLPAKADVVVVGAGIAGVAAAYYLARRKVDVLLIDRSGPAAEASSGNAGMIGESGGDPANIMRLQQRSVALYREAARTFADDFELVMDGRVRLALTEEEVARFEALVARQNAAGIAGEMLYGADVQRLEPVLSEKVIAAAWFPGDGKIHPTKATNAFFNAALAAGANFRGGVKAVGVELASGRVAGVATDQGTIAAERVVLAAGAWTPYLAATVGLVVPVFPGKGHMLATEPLPPLTSRVLRAEKLGARQFANGEVLIGSEVEHVGFDKSVQPAVIASYLRFMQELAPALCGARVARAWGCLRPMSIDLLPIIGPAPGVPGLDLITGHGRSGMSLGPASAEALAELICAGAATTLDLAPYAPDRFAQA
jgi:glycine/D-amino acid oxidase-like deaminating enzyme